MTEDQTHIAICHEDHTDYLHDGHLHHLHNDHIDEHVLIVGGKNPATCTPLHDCEGHDSGYPVQEFNQAKWPLTRVPTVSLHASRLSLRDLQQCGYSSWEGW